MDKQMRLTRWGEWVVGEMYQWCKRKQNGLPQKCIEVNHKEGFVCFDQGDKRRHLYFKWQGRFIHVEK